MTGAFIPLRHSDWIVLPIMLIRETKTVPHNAQSVLYYKVPDLSKILSLDPPADLPGGWTIGPLIVIHNLL